MVLNPNLQIDINILKCFRFLKFVYGVEINHMYLHTMLIYLSEYIVEDELLF